MVKRLGLFWFLAAILWALGGLVVAVSGRPAAAGTYICVSMLMLLVGERLRRSP
ncbi:MAG TPA: hypothetical protein VGM98_10695 [Schlesneria sp.]